jgi:hypothetical protein
MASVLQNPSIIVIFIPWRTTPATILVHVPFQIEVVAENLTALLAGNPF